ncbi:polyadenylate-binding protein 2-like [Dorcoceras hygrometricum]|uniref:Polyadenylate-binding protein 2-like n=1 Tax=Dorcoceras hygrometricum TaxID=472368 RepID=A0A2Z7B8S4_9LAMI|nr:polyadenylate-binding protein 2-like [Dorcoceras hygrometricum]
MGNTDPNKTKAGNKYEVKPQYEELSKQPISRWKSSVRDHRGPSAHHNAVETLESGSHHSDDSVGLFGHDSTVGQSQRAQLLRGRSIPPPPPPILPRGRRAPRAAVYRDRTCSDRRAEEILFVSNSSVLLVQADEGFVLPVVDLIRRSTVAYLLKCRFPCEIGRSQAPRRQRVPGFSGFSAGRGFDPAGGAPEVDRVFQ